MKNLILILAFSFSFLCVSAQKPHNKEGLPAGRDRLQQILVQRIAEELDLSGEKLEKFNAVYAEYHNASREIRRSQNPQKPNMNENSAMSDEQIEKRILRSYIMSIKSIELKQDYYYKFKEVLSPSQIKQMYDIERRFMERLNGEQERRMNRQIHKN